MLAHLVLLAALPLSTLTYPTLSRRLDVTVPGGIAVSTGDDLSGFSEFSPLEDGFLEGDTDTGGGGENGETAGAVANGATGGGSTSGSVSNGTQGSTSSFCSTTSCTSGAQSGNQNQSSTSTSSSSVSLVNGPVNNNAPLVTIGRVVRRWLMG